MKKTLMLVAFAATALMARAESLRVHVPFAFSAARTALPAGDYTITQMSPGVLLIKGDAMQTMVFARLSSVPNRDAPAVEFTDATLVGVRVNDRVFELGTPAVARSSVAMLRK